MEVIQTNKKIARYGEQFLILFAFPEKGSLYPSLYPLTHPCSLPAQNHSNLQHCSPSQSSRCAWGCWGAAMC